MASSASHAILLFGGRHQFLPNQHAFQPCVQSRMLLRCLAGRGQIRVNGKPLELTAGTWVWMPWNRAIEYCADARDPMLIGGAHIVPDFDSTGETLEFFIPHFPEDRFLNSPHRRDCVIEGLEGLVVGTFEKGDGLDLVGDYITEWISHRERTEETARHLAQLLIQELKYVANDRSEPFGADSAVIRRIRAFVRYRLDKKITLPQMAAHAGCSIPTLTRHFNRHFGCSPMQWVLRFKMEHASDLLRTTSLRINEIGERAGVSDPYYFSRLFKKMTGFSPFAYRKQRAFF